MKRTVFVALFLLLLRAASVQISFKVQDIFGTCTLSQYGHYSSIDAIEHPIDLKQYEDNCVIRISYANDEPLKEFLLGSTSKSKSNSNSNSNITYKKWGKNNNQQTLDIQIDANSLGKLVERFPTMVYKMVIKDLSQAVYETFPLSKVPLILESNNDIHSFSEEVFFKEYRDIATINSWLSLLQATYPDIIKIEDIGETFEHKKLQVVHFSVPSSEIEHREKKTVVITGGIHAREWISVSTTLYLIYKLVQLYDTWPESKMLTNLNFLFIPVFNPDGYEYTWTTDRLWRKNRQQTPVPKCFGIDIDHSYDYHWTKSSDWACGEEYSGESPFEAFESRIWNSYLDETNQQHKISGYIDLHSYSQEILYPYAYSCNQQPRDEENLLELAYGIARSIRLQSGEDYQVLPACIDKDADLLPDLGSGTSLDFMYHNKAYWAYQLKLRDTGDHGFLLPSKYIEPVGNEVYAAIKYFCSFILSDER